MYKYELALKKNVQVQEIAVRIKVKHKTTL